MTLMSDIARGQFHLRMVDATNNTNGWETNWSNRMFDHLTRMGVPMSGPLMTPSTFREADEAFLAEPDYNCLFLVTHGDVASDEGKAAQVLLGDQWVPWYLAGAVNANLDNRAVFLAVCSGFNEDSVFSLATDIQLALSLVGPNVSLGAREATAFYGTFFPEFAEQSQSGLNRDVIRMLVGEHNHLANAKMHVYPER